VTHVRMAQRQTRRFAVAAVISVALAGLVATQSTAATPAPDPGLPRGMVVSDGMTQPVYAEDEVINQRIWVETDIDTDADGRLDRVAIDIERPAGQQRVASVLTASPYWQCCQEVENHSVDVDRLPQESIFTSANNAKAGASRAEAGALFALRAAAAARTVAEVKARYVPRGYATVSAQTIGTADSDGCPTSGDRNETLSVKAVVDWLAGRGRGFDENGKPTKATWSTGKVGMIGVSYNGTLPQMVATTGVKGLETIVPISAISSWYDYYRANGLVVAPGTYQGEDTDILAKFVVSTKQAEVCQAVFDRLERAQDRVTGDWNRFWQERDYVRTADRIRASVFVVHGLNDWNVKTQHVEQFWDVLARNHVPRKIWWHQGGHGGPSGAAEYTLPDGRVSDFNDTVNRWMDHWLYGVDNGIEKEPQAIIQREDGTYRTYSDWPDARVKNRSYSFSTLGGGRRVQSFVDDGARQPAEDLVKAPDARNANRLAYATGPLAEATRISGTVRLDLNLSVDNRRAANVTGLLVDYAPGGAATIVSRGWIDPQNRVSISRSLPLKAGKRYALRFGLQPKDYVFAAGHRIGLVVISTDFDYTLRPTPGTKLGVDPRVSVLTLPVVR
jgi:X-Pro dipeptidyl-peptidase